jgi:hypothetical protein
MLEITLYGFHFSLYTGRACSYLKRLESATVRRGQTLLTMEKYFTEDGRAQKHTTENNPHYSEVPLIGKSGITTIERPDYSFYNTSHKSAR